MTDRRLPSAVQVQADLDLHDLWNRFEVFEALHHGLTIASPMSSDDVDAVADLLGPKVGDRVLDLGCGTGELLMRMAALAEVSGLGVDLSPWMIAAAHRRAADRELAKLEWLVGEARNVPKDSHDIVACLGASWIWHGLPGTIREVAARTRAGGRIAIGDMHRRDDVTAADLAGAHGPVPGSAEIESMLDAHNIDLIGRVATSERSWDRYMEETSTAVHAWAAGHPGPKAEEFLAVHGDWSEDQMRDRSILSWSVWVGRVRS
jgi:SAM-dependent methyltransferase